MTPFLNASHSRETGSVAVSRLFSWHIFALSLQPAVSSLPCCVAWFPFVMLEGYRHVGQ